MRQGGRRVLLVTGCIHLLNKGSTKNRFVATLTADSGCNDACLAFEEIVHGYRTVSLLKITFRPVPWDGVVKDIQQEYTRLKVSLLGDTRRSEKWLS